MIPPDIKKNGVSFFCWFALVVLSFHLLLGCKESENTSITESGMQATLKELAAANLNKDIKAIEKYLAPFVIINIETRTPAGPVRIQMSRDEYIAQLSKVFSQATDLQYQQENTRINIGNEGKTAEVETDVIERIVLNGSEQRTVTHERIVFEIIDGRKVATVLDASVRKKE